MTRTRNSPRAALNKIRWRPEGGLAEATIRYIHRGAPADEAQVEGAAVEEVGPGFLVIRRGREEVRVPYHRILEVTVGDEVVFRRSRVKTERPPQP